MKKVITILITLALLLSLSAPALAADVDAEPEHTTRSEQGVTTSMYIVMDGYLVANYYMEGISDLMIDMFKEKAGSPELSGLWLTLDQLAVSTLKAYREEQPTATTVVNVFAGTDQTTLLVSYVNGHKVFDLIYDVR